MITTINYSDLGTMVNNYRSGYPTAPPPHFAAVSLQDIADMHKELTYLKADGVRIYFASGDSRIKDTAGQDIMHNGFDQKTILIAVPTINKTDDQVNNGTITCITLGVTPVSDNIGMCPPTCPAPGAKFI